MLNKSTLIQFSHLENKFDQNIPNIARSSATCNQLLNNDSHNKTFVLSAENKLFNPGCKIPQPLCVKSTYTADKQNFEISWQQPTHFSSFKVYLMLLNAHSSNMFRMQTPSVHICLGIWKIIIKLIKNQSILKL